ncbi:MAG: putative glycoside hydrolase [Kiritimatiellaeota bacterium]|nr:putative glycoside hydrolase [Kiritimatiellota bacterium]
MKHALFTSITFLAALLLAPLAGLHAAAPSASPNRLPSFSWERVPRYIHIRKDTVFTADEIRYLASFPLVTFEKGTGAKDFGSTEEGTLTAARAVKKINPATKVLYYRNVIVHYGGYAANDALTNTPGAFLIGRDSSDKLVRNRVQAYDLTNAKLRDWWLASAKRVCADPAVDGLFLDGNIKVLESAYLRDEIGEKIKAGLVDGYTSMMQDARRMLGPEKLMVANVLRARFPDSGMSRLRAFDGAYMEGFETAVGNVPLKDYVAKGIAAFQGAARQGFLIAFTAGLGEEENGAGARNQQRTGEIRKSMTGEEAVTRRFNYLLALFLICAEKHSYFCAHDGYDAKKSKVWMKHPSEFDRPLGAPQGPAVRAGYVYTREFAHASVRLDLENQTGKIDWR